MSSTPNTRACFPRYAVGVFALILAASSQAQVLQFNFNGSLANSGSAGGSLALTNGAAMGAAGSGLQGGTSRALDMTSGTMGGNGGIATYAPPATISADSFTYVVWYRTTGNTVLGNKARLLDTEVNAGTVVVRGGNVASGTDSGDVSMTGSATTGAQSNVAYTSDGTWTFFAITYDGTTGNGSAGSGTGTTTFYTGTTTSPVTQVGQTLGNALNEAAPINLLTSGVAFNLGNRASGDRGFQGFLDDIAVYASPSDGTGALTQAALENLRQANVTGSSSTSPVNTSTGLAAYVNPFLGTAPTVSGGDTDRPFPFNTGNVYPGAVTPQGFVAFSPDTPSNQAGGYWYPDTSIKAFSLTHFSGRGIPYECDFGLMPIAGAISASTSFNFGNYTVGFSHANETASPGYYNVVLNNNQKVELTATTRTGMMQTTFPTGTTTGTILVNFANNVRGISNAQVNVVNGNELTGYVTSTNSGGLNYTSYVSIVFDQPITASGIWNGATLTPGATSTNTTSGAQVGAFISFNTSSSEVVHATAGVSYVSVANAELNRTTEDPSFAFNGIQQAAVTAWNAKLGVVKINDPAASVDNLTVFYTELYRTLLHPNIYDDVNGQYIGFDGATHTVASGHHFYTHIEGWGGYRSAAPFDAFFFPKEFSDVAQSLVTDSVILGGVPRWVQMNSDSHGNVGDGGSTTLAQAYAFGATNFDTGTALTYMKANAAPTNSYREYGSEFATQGWVQNDLGSSLEYCTADEALAEFAQSLGQTAVYNTYIAKAQNWRNLFNPAVQSLEARDASGNWNSSAQSYEASPAQIMWMLPFNLNALFTDMGGNATVVAQLDTFFGWNASQNMYTELNSGYESTLSSGFGGSSLYNYAGDETCEMHPWMYDYAGAPWKTQKVVRDIETTLYTNVPGGMPGNDDGGELSSWYIFAVLGIYPEVPGVGGFVIGSPLFASATVTLENGQILQINGTNAGPANPYVQSLSINGVATNNLWLPVSTILNGTTTTLTFTLGSTPNTGWGSAASNAPPFYDVPPVLLSAASVQSHAGTPFSLNLPLTGDEGVEDRVVNGSLQLVFTFGGPVISSQVTTSVGSVNLPISYSGNTMTVNVTGVNDMQDVTVTLSNLNGTGAASELPLGVLAGDVNGDGVVNALDLVGIRSNLGGVSTDSDFDPAADVTRDGTVSALDLVVIRNSLGNFLP